MEAATVRERFLQLFANAALHRTQYSPENSPKSLPKPGTVPIRTHLPTKWVRIAKMERVEAENSAPQTMVAVRNAWPTCNTADKARL